MIRSCCAAYCSAAIWSKFCNVEWVISAMCCDDIVGLFCKSINLSCIVLAKS